MKERNIQGEGVGKTDEIWKDPRLNEAFGLELLQRTNFLKKTGVIGITECVGTTFVAINLARFLCKKGLVPTVVAMGCDMYYEVIKNRAGVGPQESIKNQLLDGIGWSVFSDYDSHKLQEEHLKNQLKRVYGIKTTTGIYDFSCYVENKHCMELLMEMDRFIIVIDPMPHRMAKGERFLACLKEINKEKIFVINKYSDGVYEKELARFLGVKNYIFVPYMDMKALYKAEYKGLPYYQLNYVEKQLEKPMEKIWQMCSSIDIEPTAFP